MAIHEARRYTMADKGPEVGTVAPDFTLKDQNQKAVTRSDFKGKKVVLSFHPLAWTNVCKLQMQDLEKYNERFDRLDAVAVGLSVDSVPCKKAWAEAIGVEKTSLLADFWPHGGVASAYGIFREADGVPERIGSRVAHGPQAEAEAILFGRSIGIHRRLLSKTNSPVHLTLLSQTMSSVGNSCPWPCLFHMRTLLLSFRYLRTAAWNRLRRVIPCSHFSKRQADQAR
jgi:peroxiredoxin